MYMGCASFICTQRVFFAQIVQKGSYHQFLHGLITGLSTDGLLPIPCVAWVRVSFAPIFWCEFWQWEYFQLCLLLG